MKIHLVRGRHWEVSGDPTTAHVDMATATVAAIDLLNRLGADSTDYDGVWEAVDRDADSKTWRGALRELQAQRIQYVNGALAETVEHMLRTWSDDQLARDSECSVWIETVDVADPKPEVWAEPVTLGTMLAYRDLADKAREMLDAYGGDVPDWIKGEWEAVAAATVACENADPRG